MLAAITIGRNVRLQEQLDTAEKDPSQHNLRILLIARWSALRCCSGAARGAEAAAYFHATAGVFGMLYKASASVCHASVQHMQTKSPSATAC